MNRDELENRYWEKVHTNLINEEHEKNQELGLDITPDMITDLVIDLNTVEDYISTLNPEITNG